MNSNIYFLFVWLETILFSSTEITYFSSQLSFYLANIKSKIWQLYVIWRHHCQSTRGSYLPLLIFSYKGISALYYSMILWIIRSCFATKNWVAFKIEVSSINPWHITKVTIQPFDFHNLEISPAVKIAC